MQNKKYDNSKNPSQRGHASQGNQNRSSKAYTEADFLEKAKKHYGDYYKNLLYMITSPDEPDPVSQDALSSMMIKTDNFVKEFGGEITTGQLRNVYALIKELPANEAGLRNLVFIRPKLAYISARQEKKSETARVIPDMLNDLAKQTNTVTKLKSLQALAESIVAYHRYHHHKTEKN